MTIMKNKKTDKLREVDPLLCEALDSASTLIDAGYPTLADQRISWINKSAEILEDLVQFKTNYQFLIDEQLVRIKNLEYREYMDSIENDQYKSWNEKSLLFYGNNELLDLYRHMNHNKYVLSLLNEYINLLKYMSR